MNRTTGEFILYVGAAAALVGGLYWLHLRLQNSTGNVVSDTTSQIDALPGTSDFYGNANYYNANYFGMSNRAGLGGALGGFDTTQIGGLNGNMGQNNGGGGGVAGPPGGELNGGGAVPQTPIGEQGGAAIQSPHTPEGPHFNNS